jgi:hypothetical protein
LLASSKDLPYQNAANASVPGAEVCIAAEVQLIFEPYVRLGRKKSHLPYKVVRCERPSELMRDAASKSKAEESGDIAIAMRECAGLCEALLAKRLAGPDPSGMSHVVSNLVEVVADMHAWMAGVL